MSDTSIGPGVNRGGNENHDGDPRNKTLGEKAPAAEAPQGSVVEGVAPELPAGVPGSPAEPGIRKAADAYPDGPNVEASPWELDAARGKVPKP